MQTRAAERRAAAEAISLPQDDDGRAKTPDKSTSNEPRIVFEQRQLRITPPGDISMFTFEQQQLLTTPLGNAPTNTIEQRQLLFTPPSDSSEFPRTYSPSGSRLNIQQDVLRNKLNETIWTGRKRNYGGVELPRVDQDELSYDLEAAWIPELDRNNLSKELNDVASHTTDSSLDALGQVSTHENGINIGIQNENLPHRYELRTRKIVVLQTGTIRAAVERIWSASSTVSKQSDTTKSHNHTDAHVEHPAKRQRRFSNTAVTTSTTATEVVVAVKQKRKGRRTAENPYGLMPGETPYPEWATPTPQQCQDMYELLVKVHDDVKSLPPEKIPAPSLDVAGCGEVPSVLDGLIRTVLSGSTTFDSADKMLQALVKRFGVVESGMGEGSVNWNNVRTAAYDDVYAQLKNGGLGGVKARNIQTILSMVHEENKERRAAYIRERETGEQANIAGAVGKTRGQKELEILKADKEMLSLDHIHSMETHEAIRHFVRYPGVGVKTAACVALFSLQRPCFAVDTHVYRLSKWLGWVPRKTNEDDAFSHLEVRCPANLKYGLHQLFIRHGKICHRCNDKSFSGTDVWEATTCPLEHLIDRFTKRIAKPKEAKLKSGKTENTEGADDGDKLDDFDASMGGEKLAEEVAANTEAQNGDTGTGSKRVSKRDSDVVGPKLPQAFDSGLQA